MSEEWRQVKQHPDFEVNRKGEIRRISDGRPVRANPGFRVQGYGGYCKAALSSNGVKAPGLVHRIVAIAFIPNPENKPQVHHIDGNRANNAVENLMWVTREEHGMLHKKLEGK